MAGAGLIAPLSSVWLLAGAGKLAVPRVAASFLARLTNRPVATRTIRAFAIVEIAISVGLATPVVRPWVALASAVASVVLLAILAHARTVLSEQVPCGCFGPLVLNNRIGVGQLILVVAMPRWSENSPTGY